MESIGLHAMTVFMGFFAIMNPIANVPIFLTLTEGEDVATTRAVARRSLLIAFLIVVVFSVAGKVIFELFGITLAAFRIAGGLLILLIGFHMLQGRHSQVNHPEMADAGKTREAALDVAVSPLSMPILAGPGTITTAMSFSARGGLVEMMVTIGAFAVLCVLTFLFFVSGRRILSLVGHDVLGVITRLMGLILAVIGVQMLIEGISSAFHLGV
ncbi:MAG: MarC family protein [Kiritimatiellales bacterium]